MKCEIIGVLGFVGVGRFWVLPKIGCTAWQHLVCRQAPT